MHRKMLVIALIGLFAAGCSQDEFPTAPVEGVVMFKGKPVPHAKVTFFPQKLPGAATAFGHTDAEGKFSKVVTAGTMNGAAVGSHFVTVTESWPAGEKIPLDDMGTEKVPPRGPWAQKYRDSSTGELKVDVVAGKTNHFEFDLSK